MPARPDEISRILPGSGTGVGGGGGGGGGVGPGEHCCLVESQPPDGSGGGKIPGKPKPLPGAKSGEAGAPCGSNAASSRLNSADSKLPGNGICLAVPPDA